MKPLHLLSSLQLWLPHKNQPVHIPSGKREGLLNPDPLAEQLPTLGGFWRRQSKFFSSGWPHTRGYGHRTLNSMVKKEGGFARRTGEVAQQLREHTALLEDLSLTPSAPPGSSQTPVNSGSRGSNASSLQRYPHTCSMHSWTQTHTHDLK